MPLKVSVEDKGDGVFAVRPEGAIDSNTFVTLGLELESLVQKSPKLIIFDFKDVHYVSSAGIGVVLLAEQDLKPNGKVLLVNLQPQIKKVFEIAKVLPSNQIFNSLEEMDECLDAVQRTIKDSKG